MEPFRDTFGLRHSHPRFALDTKPRPLEEDCHVPRGPCWWCNRCGTDNYIFAFTCRVCRKEPNWPDLRYQQLEKYYARPGAP
eukprot:13898851-Alexandrium_andersonii.AAC.1